MGLSPGGAEQRQTYPSITDKTKSGPACSYTETLTVLLHLDATDTRIPISVVQWKTHLLTLNLTKIPVAALEVVKKVWASFEYLYCKLCAHVAVSILHANCVYNFVKGSVLRRMYQPKLCKGAAITFQKKRSYSVSVFKLSVFRCLVSKRKECVCVCGCVCVSRCPRTVWQCETKKL